MTSILTALASTYPDSPSSPSFLSINAEDLPEISESYDVTAVPFLVLLKGDKTVETVSGSDAGKVRSAVEKHASSSGQKAVIPPMQEVTPRQQPEEAPHASNEPATNGEGTKNLSQYAPKDSDPKTAPEYSSTQGSKEELNTRLANLVKAAPVMLFMKGTPSAPQCGFSRQLVALLRERQVKYGMLTPMLRT